GGKAGCEDIVSDLRNNGVALGSHHFEIGPPLRECAVALGNAMEADARHVAANRQSAFDYFVGEDVIPIVHAEQNFPHETLPQRKTTHAADLIARPAIFDHAALDS